MSTLNNVKEADVLKDIRRVSKLTEVLTRDIYRSVGKFASSTVESKFSTWSNAKRKAGVKN